MLELAFGYNGTERLLGQTTGLARGDMNGAGGGNMQNNGTMQAPNHNESSGGTSSSQNRNSKAAGNQNSNGSFGAMHRLLSRLLEKMAPLMKTEVHLQQADQTAEMEDPAVAAEKA